MSSAAPARWRSPPPGSLAALVCAVVVLGFFAAALDPGVQFGLRDTGRLHHPGKRWFAAELRRGHLPEWNPYAGLGQPIVAGAVDVPLHPLNALYLVLPFEAAFKAWILICYLGAALGGHALGRALGAGVPSSLIAGLGFALSGFLLSASDNILYLTSLAALPAVFAAATAWIARGGRGRLAWVALAAALCIAGGDPQAWGIALLCLPGWGAVLLARERGVVSGLLRGLGAAAVAALASAPVALPILAWLPASSRGVLTAAEAGRWNLHPSRLAELVVPFLYRPLSPGPSSEVYRVYAGDALTPIPWAASVYCGAALLALAVLGAQRSRRARAMVIGAAVLTWMALGPHAGWTELAARLPIAGAFRYWEKLAVWPALLMAGAAAVGAERATAGEIPSVFPRALALLGTVALGLGMAAGLLHPALVDALARGPGTGIAAATLAFNLADGLRWSGLSALTLGAILILRQKGRMGAARCGWAMLALVVVDLGVAGHAAWGLVRLDALRPPVPLARVSDGGPPIARVVTPFELTLARFPDRPAFESVAMWGARTLAPPWNVAERVGNLEPYVGVVPRRLARLLEARRPGERVPLAGLWGIDGLVVPRDPSLAADVGVPPPWTVRAADPELPAFVVALPHRPRAYVAREVEARDEAGALAFALDRTSAASARSIIEGPVEGRSATGTAVIERDEGERVVVQAEADAAALLVLNDLDAPGWSATVDGIPARIHPTNYLARGVWIPAGAHRVEFRYRTPGLAAGWSIALALALSLAIPWTRVRRGLRWRRHAEESTP